MTHLIQHEGQIPASLATQRLDQAVSALFPQYSRARLQEWIKNGELTLDGRTARSKDKVTGGEAIVIEAVQHDVTNTAEAIPLTIVFEDESILIVNKEAGLVVHPGAGNATGTLLNALLNHDKNLAMVPRAGIVHRLDKDTSGLMVVAKNIETQNYLVKEIQARTVVRIYDAIVYGVMKRSRGTVDAPIARHPNKRTQMAIRSDGKPAVTHYEVRRQFRHHALVACKLETGRTHQIRVHMQSLGFPLVGDPTYGGHYRRPAGGAEELIEALRNFPRQALHARKLALKHPQRKKLMEFSAEPPEDFLVLHEELCLAED